MPEYEGLEVSPSQEKALKSLREATLEGMPDGFELKRFEVDAFSSAKILEVLIETGKVDETARDVVFNRKLRQIFVGERGGCELVNPADPKKRGKIKGLQECISTEI